MLENSDPEKESFYAELFTIESLIPFGKVVAMTQSEATSFFIFGSAYFLLWQLPAAAWSLTFFPLYFILFIGHLSGI